MEVSDRSVQTGRRIRLSGAFDREPLSVTSDLFSASAGLPKLKHEILMQAFSSFRKCVDFADWRHFTSTATHFKIRSESLTKVDRMSPGALAP